MALALAAPCIAAVFFAFILPYCASFWQAFTGKLTILENASLLHITAFTIKQAFLSVLVSLALGLPGAWYLGSGKPHPILRTMSALPFAMPSILVVLGFVLFFGNSGWVNWLIGAITGREGPLRILYKPGAIILAHGFFNFPLVVRLAGDGLARVRKSYAPAAANLGSSPLMTAFYIILPLAIPSLMAASLLVFLYSFTSFAVVLVLGGGPASTTLPVEIYRHAKIFLNYHNAGALALVETLIAISIFLAYVFFGRKARETETDIEDQGFEIVKSSGSRFNIGSLLLTLYCLFAALFILGPIFSIILESFLWQPSRSAVKVISFIWWRSLGETCLPSLFRSLLLAFISASAACILAILSAGSVKILDMQGKWKRSNFPLANIIRFTSAAPIVSSGIVLGLGWLILYGRHLSFAPLSLVILHSVIALPFAFNSIAEGFRSLPENTLAAASVLGASPIRMIFTIAIPLSFKRVCSAWGFAAALSLGELNSVMMLGMEKWETLPLYIYRAAGAYRYGTACSAGTLLILSCAACLLLSEGFNKKIKM